MPSVNFSNLLSAVSDMISHIHSAILEQSFLAHRGRPEPNMLFFLPIMLFGNAQFFTDYAQNYARLCQ